MADVKFSTFVAGLSADTIGGSEKIPVIDTTPFHITPDLLVTYVNVQQIAAGVLTPTDGDELHGDRSGTQGVFTVDSLSAYVVDDLEALTVGATIVAGDWLIYSDGGVLKRVLVSTLNTLLNTTNGTLGAQITALSTATLADTDEYIVSQSGTAAKAAFSAVAARVHDQIGTYTAALDAVVTPVDADKLYILQGSTAKYMTLTVFANTYLAGELNLEDFVWATATTTPSLAGDKLLMERSGTISEVDIDTLSTYFSTGLQAAVLTFSGLGAATPNAADLFAVEDSGTAKKITLANLETKLWTDFEAYVIALTENTTAAGTDKIYTSQGGTPKWADLDTLSTFFNTTSGDVLGPVTTTEDQIPQWDSVAKTLKDGLTLVTSITPSGMTDTQIPTAQAVDEYYGGAAIEIDGLTDLGEALVDADLLIVDNGATGLNRKSTLSRVWTYIGTKIKALTDKAAPVAADILMIQDSEASNVLKELTIANLDTLIHPSLATSAGTGITAAAASYVEGVETVGTFFKTTIAIDLTGLRSTAANDIIGADGTSNPCHIGQITAARNGTIFAGKIECLEVPAGGDPDIDLYSATEATGVEDDAISGLTETQLINAGDHVVDAFKSLTAFPAANEYLYLVAGDTTDADYTTGILVITLWGK